MPRFLSALAVARLLWRFAAMLAGIGAATLLASGQLIENTLQVAQQEAFTARFRLTAQHAATAAENALALRVPLTPDSPLAALLAREAALEPAMRSFAILSAQEQPLLSAPLPGAPLQATATDQVRAPIRNDLGDTVGAALLRYDGRALQAAQQHLHDAVWQAVWPALLLWGAALGGLCWTLVRRLRRHATPLPVPGGERALLTAAAALGLGLTLTWVGWQATAAGQTSIQPDQLAKAQAVARSSAALIARALEVGVPVQELAGVPAHAATLQAENPEIVTLAVREPGGQWVAGQAPAPGAWTVTAPALVAGAPRAEVVLTLDPTVLARTLQATLLDMAFLGAVCLLMALEWVALGLGTRGARALAAWETRRGRLARQPLSHAPHAQGAAAVRPALFLFMLAEELTRPFLPTWARTLAPADWGLSPDLLASLPLVVFLAVVGLLQWPLAVWSERFGRRRGMVLGAVLGAAGLAWAAAWPGYGALVAGRLLGALGFAMVFVSAQGAVIDVSSAPNRARSLAQFVRAILVAALCGPPLGGLAADHWGVPAAFALAACAALLAALVAWVQMPRQHGVHVAATATTPRPAPALSGVLRQPGLARLLLGCALPAKLLLAALCFYLLPLHLQDMGHGSAVTGRLQTIYPLTMVLLVPLAARLADRWSQRSLFVWVGGLLTGGSALLAWPGGSGLWPLALVLLGLGVGQALSITPQSALIADMARSLPARQGAGVLGLFRLTERGGSALGPAMSAWLLPMLGFGPTVAAVGALVLGGSLAYGWSLRGARAAARSA